MRSSRVRIALVYPELLGTYGDGGNALICHQRLSWRGIDAEVVRVAAGQPVPAGCDLYLLGGGEDEPQALAAAGVRSGGLAAAVTAGAAVLAVCAGFQILGAHFPGRDASTVDGAGLIDATTRPGSPRLVGDLAVAPARDGLPLLYGYENHGGRTELGEVAPLGSAVVGGGNGDGSGADGAYARVGAGLIIATYLHGPVLAQNPALADLLLGHVTGPLPPLAEEHERPTARLRRARARQLGR